MSIRNDTRLEDFLGRVNEYGNAERRGLNAKPDYARDGVDMSHNGVISDDHAENVWKGFSAAAGRTKGSERARTSTAKTDKVRISETKTLIGFGKFNADHDPLDVFDRAVNIINENHDAKGSTYQNLVVVARAQLKKRAEPLTDQEIVDAITPAAPETKAEEELLQ